VVVVGKTSKDELMKRVQEAFGSLPKSTYTPAVYKTPVYKTNKFLSEERDLATNYITGAFNAPRMIEAGYVPYKLAVAALSERLFTEIRTKRNLSYAPYAYSANRMLPFGVMYVTTTQPKEAVQIMVNELKKIKAQGFTPTELQNAKSHFITSNYMKEESSAAIAASLGTAEVLGDWKIAEAMPEKVMHVTLEDMNRSLGNIDTINWSYLGNKKAADDATGIFNMTVSAVK
jgi:predicted Zn-dependent peptidase